jgi:hypothetical protein
LVNQSFAGPLLYRKEADFSFSIDAIVIGESCWCLFNDQVAYGVMKGSTMFRLGQCHLLSSLFVSAFCDFRSFGRLGGCVTLFSHIL